MDNKIDIIAKCIKKDCELDYFDRLLCPTDGYVYIFEANKQLYVWQSKDCCTLELTEGSTYHLKAVIGDRLLEGRGLSINEVEIVGEMNIDNKVIRVIFD
ncbi:hypothetical protein [Paenibacillus odorifer]|uniref:hypothetical protein n=1 Tax=Paenibacillus odorifer TaxID=189426 RepID=UPI00096F6A87|nr:hypothetical protein [Paenibacillus odorifer]OMD09851.1 hypothetical protein BJP50_29400 [Paenibacillus odorifer]